MMARSTWIERTNSGRTRVLFAAAFGVGAAVIAAFFGPWQLTVLIGWNVAALVMLGSVWGSVVRFSAAQTKTFAIAEDDTRAGTQLTLLGASVVSLVGVAAAFLKANQGNRALETVLEGMGVLTIACSWALVHTVFALRYAHIYYRSEPPGGIDFKMRDVQPDYRDFAYTAFTVGMTFQVSDTDITSQEMRRAVLRHALLSFLFGAVILATTVNVIAGLLNA
jgi:uncharacterized membrane protein